MTSKLNKAFVQRYAGTHLAIVDVPRPCWRDVPSGQTSLHLLGDYTQSRLSKTTAAGVSVSTLEAI